MRGFAVFVAGALSALAIQTAIAQNESSSPNVGIVQLNHVAIIVPDFDKAVEYNTKTLGFPEAYCGLMGKGPEQYAVVQISKDTFIELQPATAQRPSGIDHFGVQVENIEAVKAMYAARGLRPSETSLGDSGNLSSSIFDPDGVRMQLFEIPPGTVAAQAIASWK